MNHHRLPLFPLFVIAGCLGVSWAEAEDPTQIRIAIVGDSTAASYPNPPKDRPDLTGWGQVIGELFDGRVTVLNHARSGRSSKSFIKEGWWQKTLETKPDFVFIQFGHNDCPGKGDRTTDPRSSYRDYLNSYIDDARRIDAQPILVTPMTRRVFRNGKIQTILRPYAEAMLAVAREKQIPVVDLHAASVKLFNDLGDQASADYSPSDMDRTHFSRKGAFAMARIVATLTADVEPRLKPHIRID